jgi:hypothetical protein
MGIGMVNDTYNRLTTLNTPARITTLFRQWISIAKNILQPKPEPMMAPGPMAGPPGAGPQMQPQGAPAQMMAPMTGGLPNGIPS